MTPQSRLQSLHGTSLHGLAFVASNETSLWDSGSMKASHGEIVLRAVLMELVYIAMNTVQEIEAAIWALSPTDREKLIRDLPMLLPELERRRRGAREAEDARFSRGNCSWVTSEARKGNSAKRRSPFALQASRARLLDSSQEDVLLKRQKR